MKSATVNGFGGMWFHNQAMGIPAGCRHASRWKSPGTKGFPFLALAAQNIRTMRSAGQASPKTVRDGHVEIVVRRLQREGQ